MKRVKEGISNFYEDNPLIIVIILTIAVGFLSHWLSIGTYLNEILKGIKF